MSDDIDIGKGAVSACPHQMSCVITGKCGEHPLCEVETCLDENILSLKSKRPPDCCFGRSSPTGDLCSCPQRYALFLKIYVGGGLETGQDEFLRAEYPTARSITPVERRMMIEKEAYFIAARNAFLGNPADYWAEAEKLVDFKLALYAKPDQA